MKKLFSLFVFVLCLASLQAQQFVKYSADSSRIKYATFSEVETSGMVPEVFFATFLGLDPQNRFVATDTMYSPVLRVKDANGNEHQQKIVRR